MAQREYRFTANKELRIVDNNGKRTLTGYAAVFNSPSEDLGGWTETIVPGAFTRSLASKPDVMALSEHDPKKGLLGRTRSNTLRLVQDDIGLRFECDLPDTTLGNDIATSITRGDIDGCSFGFIAQDTKWSETNSKVVRSLLDVDLFDVTVTASPAYPATSVQMRSKMFPDGLIEIPKEFRSDDVDEDDTTGCQCDCPECLAGDCPNCSDDDCTFDECRCGDMRTNKLLASILERRLRWSS